MTGEKDPFLDLHSTGTNEKAPPGYESQEVPFRRDSISIDEIACKPIRYPHHHLPRTHLLQLIERIKAIVRDPLL